MQNRPTSPAYDAWTHTSQAASQTPKCSNLTHQTSRPNGLAGGALRRLLVKTIDNKSHPRPRDQLYQEPTRKTFPAQPSAQNAQASPKPRRRNKRPLERLSHARTQRRINANDQYTRQSTPQALRQSTDTTRYTSRPEAPPRTESAAAHATQPNIWPRHAHAPLVSAHNRRLPKG